MSDTVLAVPVSRLFLPPEPAAGPTAAERAQLAAETAYADGVRAAEDALGSRIAGLETELLALREAHSTALAAQAVRHAAALEALEEAFATALSGLGLAIARAVLATEPVIGATTVRELVTEALNGLPAGAGGVMRMHPLDMAGSDELPPGWIAVADETLQPGQVRAERGPSLSAAGLGERLAQLQVALEDRA